MSALTKVETSLSERYMTTCEHCGYRRQVFGTATEARASAGQMRWAFRTQPGVVTVSAIESRWPKEVASCPQYTRLVTEKRAT